MSWSEASHEPGSGTLLALGGQRQRLLTKRARQVHLDQDCTLLAASQGAYALKEMPNESREELMGLPHTLTSMQRGNNLALCTFVSLELNVTLIGVMASRVQVMI